MSIERADSLFMPHHALSPILFGGRDETPQLYVETEVGTAATDVSKVPAAIRATKLLFNFSATNKRGSKGLLEQLVERVAEQASGGRELPFMVRNYRLVAAGGGEDLAHRQVADAVVRSDEMSGLALHLQFNPKVGVQAVSLQDESAANMREHPCFVTLTADERGRVAHIKGFMDSPGGTENQFELTRQPATPKQLVALGSVALHFLSANIEPDIRPTLLQ